MEVVCVNNSGEYPIIHRENDESKVRWLFNHDGIIEIRLWSVCLDVIVRALSGLDRRCVSKLVFHRCFVMDVACLAKLRQVIGCTSHVEVSGMSKLLEDMEIPEWCHSVETLSVADVRLSSINFDSFLLKLSPTVHTLEFRDCTLGSRQLDCIFRFAAGRRLKMLRFGNMCFGHGELACISRAVPDLQMDVIRFDDMSCGNHDDYTIQTLLEIFRHVKTVPKLIFRSCDLHIVPIECLIELLMQNTTIRELDILGNDFRSADVWRLFNEGVRHSLSIRSIALKLRYHLNFDERNGIMSVIKRHMILETVYMAPPDHGIRFVMSALMSCVRKSTRRQMVVLMSVKDVPRLGHRSKIGMLPTDILRRLAEILGDTDVDRFK